MILLHKKRLLSECENVAAGKCQEDKNSREVRYKTVKQTANRYNQSRDNGESARTLKEM